jgi:hypothetical protein
MGEVGEGSKFIRQRLRISFITGRDLLEDNCGATVGEQIAGEKDPLAELPKDLISVVPVHGN